MIAGKCQPDHMKLFATHVTMTPHILVHPERLLVDKGGTSLSLSKKERKLHKALNRRCGPISAFELKPTRPGPAGRAQG